MDQLTLPNSPVDILPPLVSNYERATSHARLPVVLAEATDNRLFICAPSHNQSLYGENAEMA